MGLGDDLMVSGHARVAQAKDTRRILVMHQNKPAWSEVWERNPRIAKPGSPEAQGDVQLLYARSIATNMRPYHLSKTSRQWTYNLDYRPDVGEIEFSYEEMRFAAQFKPHIIIEPNIKPGASPNKQWGWERWNAFSDLAVKAGLRLYQIGPRGTRKLQNTTLIDTRNFRLGCALLARAKGYVGGEGGLHHAAAALGIPGVVVFGGFTPIELTGYAMHRNLGVSLGDACGMRVPCDHCKREMAKITPEEVLQHLKEVLSARADRS